MGGILKAMWNDFMGYEEYSAKSVDYIKSSVEIVPRTEWGAKPPASTEEFSEYDLPLHVAYVRPTGTSECVDRRSCIRVMKKLQRRDMRNGMPDVQHNFYIGGDGCVYEGRGWNYMRTPFDEDDLIVNSSISIGVIGPWEVPNKMPPQHYVNTAVHLINYGTKIGALRGDCLHQSANARFTV